MEPNWTIFPILEIDQIILEYLDKLSDFYILLRINQYYHEHVNRNPVYLEFKHFHMNCDIDDIRIPYLNRSEKLFLNACEGGYPNVIKYFPKMYPGLIYCNEHTFFFGIAFNYCADSGSLGMMKLLLDMVNHIIKIDIHLYSDYAFRKFCENGNLDCAKWLYDYGIRINSPVDIHVNSDDAFWRACINGHIELTKWLLEIFDNTNSPLDPDIIDRSLFFECCYNGKLETAKLLVSIGKQFGENIYIQREPYLFLMSCKNGWFQMAKWLYKLGNKPENWKINIHTNNEEAFRLACENGHMKVAQWLLSLPFKSPSHTNTESDYPINIHAEQEYAFRWSCAHGYLEMAQWLYAISNNEINIRVSSNFAFVQACVNGHFEIAKWLCTLCWEYVIKKTVNGIDWEVHKN